MIKTFWRSVNAGASVGTGAVLLGFSDHYQLSGALLLIFGIMAWIEMNTNR